MDALKPNQYRRWTHLYAIGILLSLLLVGVSIYLWKTLHNYERKHLEQQLQDASILIINPLQNAINNYFETLIRMGKRWNVQNGTPQTVWYVDAENYFKDTGIFEGISYVNKDMIVEWIVPRELKKKWQGFDISQLASRKAALLMAKSLNKPIISHVFNLIQGPRGFLFIVPVSVNDQFNGYIIGAISVKKLFEEIFSYGLGEDYGIAVYQDNEPVFSNGKQVSRPYLVRETQINIGNIQWKIYVWPTSHLVEKLETWLPVAVTLCVLMSALLLFIIFHFYLRSRLNALSLEEARIAADKNAEQLNKIIDTVHEGYMAFDENEEILAWNPHAEKLLGWLREEAIGKNVYDLTIPKRHQEKHRKILHDYIKYGKANPFSKEIEFPVITKSGKELTVEVVMFPLKSKEGKYNFHVFTRDISARKKMEESQARLAAIVSSSDDAIVSYNQDGVIDSWNQGAVKMYGYQPDEMIGKMVTEIYPDELKSTFPALLMRLNKGEHVKMHDTNRKRKNGEIFPASVFIAPMLDAKKNIIGFASVARDISERKQIEKMKNEFISIVSHELRTPLTSIRGSLGILASEKTGELSHQAKQLLNIANNNCERLIRLINDILDIEKIEAGKMEFHFNEINLIQLIQDAINANAGLVEKFGIKLIFEHDEIKNIIGDYDRLTQVVINLLSNAIRYSPEQGTVTIKATEQDETVRVSIIDHGPGVPENFTDKIFGKFSQADSSDKRKKGGTGLGLSISKAIIEKHDGRIGFHSENNTTEFYFILPRKNKKNNLAQDNIKILICDSNSQSANFLKELLKENFINADIADSASTAKKMLSEEKYALIALDLLLKNEDGISFIKDLRENIATKFIPIIIISIDPKAAEKQFKLIGNGFPIIDWLEKPVDQVRVARLVQYIHTHFSVKMPNILSIEDDADITQLLKLLLQDKAKIMAAGNLKEAKEMLANHEFDLVVLDLNLPDGYGTQLLPVINANTKLPIPTIVFSIDELEEKYAYMVHNSLLKSKATNDQIVQAIEAIIAK